MRPNIPPNAITIGKVTDRSQIAGAPSCAPHSPTETIATMWSSPEIGCSNPLMKPPAASPSRICAEALSDQSSKAHSRTSCLSVLSCRFIAPLPSRWRSVGWSTLG